MFEHALPPRQVPLQHYSLGMYPETMSRAAMDVKNSHSHGNEMAHQRNLSVNSAANSHCSSPVFSSSTGMPGPPPPTPAMTISYSIGPGSICDGSSRSTSAYSNIPFSSLPMMSDQLGQLTGHHAPSGQLKAILNTMNVSNTNRTLFSTVHGADFESKSMPPPPLPQHALDAKVYGTPHRRAFTCPEPSISQQEQAISASGDRRLESQSNASDVSMHAACTSYPNCTSEDAEGHIVHTPSADVQGRKEGAGNGKSEHCMFAIRV